MNIAFITFSPELVCTLLFVTLRCADSCRCRTLFSVGWPSLARVYPWHMDGPIPLQVVLESVPGDATLCSVAGFIGVQFSLCKRMLLVSVRPAFLITCAVRHTLTAGCVHLAVHVATLAA